MKLQGEQRSTKARNSVMGLTYAIGDIHGRHDLLISLLETIKRQADQQPYRLVFLGDYIDRGPDSAKVVASVRELQGASPNDVICLKGNHEDMLLQAIGRPLGTYSWIENGGVDIPLDVLAWMEGLPTLWEDDKRYFVHAGLYPGLDISRRTDRYKLWIRNKFLDSDFDFGKHVVHGHTPDRGGPQLFGNRTNLDTGAIFGGPLTAGVFNNEQGGPIVIIQARADGTVVRPLGSGPKEQPNR
jgi:serine/threonine protein phosphatase 1